MACSTAVLASIWYGRRRRFSGIVARSAISASKSRVSISWSAAGVWKPETSRERLSSSRTSWNQMTSPLVEYRNGTPYSPWNIASWLMPFGVPLRLHQHPLRAERDLLGLNDALNSPSIAQSIVGRAVGGFELLNGRFLVA